MTTLQLRSWNPELDQSWLHVWLAGSDGDSEVGEVWKFWTEPPYLTDEEDEIRRRSDGQPYTPEWRAPDRVVIYDPEVERCIGLVELTTGPNWNEDDACFWQKARVLAWPGVNGHRHPRPAPNRVVDVKRASSPLCRTLA